MVSTVDAQFTHPLVDSISGFLHGVRRCRTRPEFVLLMRDHLAAAYSAERRPIRAARLEVLGRCQHHPELARTVAQATRSAARLLGEALAIARTRGWVTPDLDTEMLAVWIIGQINGRILVELDDAYDDQQLAAWDSISIDSIVAATGNASPPVVERTRRRLWHQLKA